MKSGIFVETYSASAASGAASSTASPSTFSSGSIVFLVSYQASFPELPGNGVSNENNSNYRDKNTVSFHT